MKEKILALYITILLITGILVGCILQNETGTHNGGFISTEQKDEITDMKSFSDFEDMGDFILENQELAGSYRSFGNLSADAYSYRANVDSAADSAPSMSNEAGSGSSSTSYSTTNVQEVVVDEVDMMKTDGRYVYVISSDQKRVNIAEVYPTGDAAFVTDIENEGVIEEIYLNGDKLIIISEDRMGYRERYNSFYGCYYHHESISNTVVDIYDIENRAEPVLFRQDVINGSLVSSRLIGGQLYLIGRQSISGLESEGDLPASPSDIFYVDEYDDWYSFTMIGSINVQSELLEPNVRVLLLGSSSEIYVSTNNIYLTHTKIMSWVEKKEREMVEVVMPLLDERNRVLMNETIGSDGSRSEKLSEMDRIVGEYVEGLSYDERRDFFEKWQDERYEFEARIAPDFQKTAIHRIEVYAGSISLKASGEVPGYILNRFSMGEYDGYFRIATTTGHVSRSDEGSAKNHLYVLNMDLIITGSVNDIAPGERIYSARFLGDRGYLVTFDKVDPFFVIDLRDPTNPTILGELKIPGYSDYLHPYDENHVIGLGKETVLAESGEFAWYQGVKLSLFDVTDVNNPKELSKFIIGDRGTYSIAQNDPHAFLFSLSKNLLVLPIYLYEHEYPETAGDSKRGEFVWDGAYVFDVSIDQGFQLKGRITHDEDQSDAGYRYYYGGGSSILRSFYINDVLYTVSYDRVMGHDLNTLNEKVNVKFPEVEEEYPNY